MSELRDLLCAASIAIRREEGVVDDEHDVLSGAIDITSEFFSACEKLELGELVKFEQFQLGEAMSAVELMDPKMDVGMVRFNKRMGYDVCIEAGLLTGSPEEQLTIVDATLCTFVAWLEGNCIAQTLWTNVMLTVPNLVEHEVYSALAHAFAHIVPLVRSVINSASVYDEEDFSSILPYAVQSQFKMQQATDLLKITEHGLSKRAMNVEPGHNRCVLQALAARMAFLRFFIQTITLLVPPMNENCAYDFNEGGQIQNISGFRPNLRGAAESAERMMLLASTLKTSSALGIPYPEGVTEDSDFGWLCAFEPEFNRRYMPSTFPRKTVIPSRSVGLPYLHRFSSRLLCIARESSIHAIDAVQLGDFLKSFNNDDSCVLTRAILQIVMFPVDDTVLGEIPLCDVVRNTIKISMNSAVYVPGNALSDCENCYAFAEEFVHDMARVYLTLFQIYGCNIARQREKIALAFEDMRIMTTMSERLDATCKAAVEAVARDNSSILPGDYSPSFATFMSDQTLALLTYYLELSFRAELFAPYEFNYLYWYLGEIVGQWRISTYERIQELLYMGFRPEPVIPNTRRKKNVRRAKWDEVLRSRLGLTHSNIILQYAQITLNEAYSRTFVALRKMGKINVPMWNDDSERLRFEHRMAPFAPLGAPLYLPYEVFVAMRKSAEMDSLPPEQVLIKAAESFDLAKNQFDQLEERGDYVNFSKSLVAISKNNAIVTRLLASGKMADRNIHWQFSSPLAPLYPLFKLVSATAEK